VSSILWGFNPQNFTCNIQSNNFLNFNCSVNRVDVSFETTMPAWKTTCQSWSNLIKIIIHSIFYLIWFLDNVFVNDQFVNICCFRLLICELIDSFPHRFWIFIARNYGITIIVGFSIP
jgi:hypothetical protein